MSDDPDYEVPFGEPWDTVTAVADATWLEPQEACEALRRLAALGYRVVPVE